MDGESKKFFNESPANILKLEEDISSGVYNDIMGIVDYERTLGRLDGISDMEAYIQVAKAKAQQEAQPEVIEDAVEKPTPKPSKSKRKAAGISKRAPAKKTKQTYDYMNMSDEEFEQLVPETSLY